MCPVTKEIGLDGKIAKKIGKLATKVMTIVGPIKGQIDAQEIVGEFGTALIINLLGFQQCPFKWSWSQSNQGPDQVSRYQKGAIDVWGIFEAKGGTSKLSDKPTQWGTQMSKGWISHWLKEIIRLNSGPQKIALQTAWTSGAPMLAAVVKLNLLNVGHQFRIVIQRYKGRTGDGMRNWGNDV